MEQKMELAAGGIWLKNLREEWQITLGELAEQVGAPSREWLARVEAGESNIARDLFAGFARSFNMTVAEFADAYSCSFGQEKQAA